MKTAILWGLIAPLWMAAAMSLALPIALWVLLAAHRADDADFES